MLFVAVQYDIAWEDKATNHRRIEAMLDTAAVPAGAFVLLPELGDTGFSFDLDAIVDDGTLPWAADLARRRAAWIQVGFARRDAGGRGLNCAAVVSPEGAVIAEYRKVHPFSFGRESAYYTGGTDLALATCGNARVCPLICYDLRFPELWRVAVAPGRAEHEGAPAEVFTIGASWPDARQAHWRLLVARAIENQAFVVGVNRIGSDPTLSYAGGSIVVSPRGEVLAEAGASEAVLTVELDLADLRRWRAEFPALTDIRPGLIGHLPAAPTA